MAKYIGTISSDARGKIGGLILTRGRNGTNFKAHAVPLNPSSLLQQYVRGVVASAQVAWRAKGGDDMNSWNFFAANYTWVNSLGQPFTPTGIQLWTQAYVNAARFGTVPPTAWSGTLPILDPITEVLLVGDHTFLIALASDGAGAYANHWLMYCSRPLPAGINYVKNISRRFCAKNTGTNEIFLTTPYAEQFGVLPPAYSFIGFNAVGVDAVTYISATPYKTIGQVIP